MLQIKPFISIGAGYLAPSMYLLLYNLALQDGFLAGFAQQRQAMELPVNGLGTHGMGSSLFPHVQQPHMQQHHMQQPHMQQPHHAHSLQALHNPQAPGLPFGQAPGHGGSGSGLPVYGTGSGHSPRLGPLGRVGSEGLASPLREAFPANPSSHMQVRIW